MRTRASAGSNRSPRAPLGVECERTARPILAAGFAYYAGGCDGIPVACVLRGLLAVRWCGCCLRRL